MIKNISLVVVAAVAVLAGGYFLNKPVINVNIPEKALGAFPGTSITSPIVFYNSSSCSNTFATTSTGAGTLTYNNLLDKCTILSTNAGALTLTLPASTTLTSFLPKAGDRTEVLLVNQGTATLTLAGGTGTLLQSASSTKAVVIGGSAVLNFSRKANSDIVVNMVSSHSAQ